MLSILVVVLLTTITLSSGQGARNLQILAEFKELEYVFPSPAVEAEATRSGKYVPGNGAPIDVDIHYRSTLSSRVFITVPRFSTGIPITLGTLVPGNRQSGPKLAAYPNYESHSSHGKDCNGITSVFRVAIDACERMWVLDAGMIGSTQHCPPSLHVFNLKTDQRISHYIFPTGQYRQALSLFVTPVVDVLDPPPSGQCTNTMVYIADITGFGIIVYDARKNKSWRVQNKLLFPTPKYGTHTIAGQSFDLMDGIIGLALTPKPVVTGGGNRNQAGYGAQNQQNRGNTQRHLYFHTLASITENTVPLSVLNNETLWTNNLNANPRDFKILGNRRTQSAGQAMDSNGNLFFGLQDTIQIGCWNINNAYGPDTINVVADNPETLQFASGVKVIRNGDNEEELWVSTCRLQKIMTGTKNSNEVNFRIMGASIRNLLGGRTTCTLGKPQLGNLAFPIL